MPGACGPSVTSCSFSASSAGFDILTFLILRIGFHASATLFRSGRFIESTLTELAVMLVLRINRPFYRSRPGRARLLSSIAIAITTALPCSPLAGSLGLAAIPSGPQAALTGLIVLYVFVNASQMPLPPMKRSKIPRVGCGQVS